MQIYNYDIWRYLYLDRNNFILKLEYDKQKTDPKEKEKLLNNYNFFSNLNELKISEEKINQLIKQYGYRSISEASPTFSIKAATIFFFFFWIFFFTTICTRVTLSNSALCGNKLKDWNTKPISASYLLSSKTDQNPYYDQGHAALDRLS